MSWVIPWVIISTLKFLGTAKQLLLVTISPIPVYNTEAEGGRNMSASVMAMLRSSVLSAQTRMLHKSGRRFWPRTSKRLCRVFSRARTSGIEKQTGTLLVDGRRLLSAHVVYESEARIDCAHTKRIELGLDQAQVELELRNIAGQDEQSRS